MFRNLLARLKDLSPGDKQRFSDSYNRVVDHLYSEKSGDMQEMCEAASSALCVSLLSIFSLAGRKGVVKTCLRAIYSKDRLRNGGSRYMFTAIATDIEVYLIAHLILGRSLPTRDGLDAEVSAGRRLGRLGHVKEQDDAGGAEHDEEYDEDAEEGRDASEPAAIGEVELETSRAAMLHATALDSVESNDVDDGKLEALAASAQEAEERDYNQLMRGIQISNYDIPATGIPLNADGVVMLRLTRMARSPQLRAHLVTTAVLESDRKLVTDAGCSFEPSWAGGALVLVPLTPEQVSEEGLDVKYDTVIALCCAVGRIKEALKEFNCEGKKRPTISSIPADIVRQKRSRGGEAGVSSNLAGPWVAAPAAESLDVGIPEEESEDAPVEIEAVAPFQFRTDSSVGLPMSPYCMGIEVPPV